MADDELHNKNEEAEEHSAVADDERNDRDVEAGEAGSMCQDELQRVHNIDDTDELVGQEHTDDDERRRIMVSITVWRNVRKDWRLMACLDWRRMSHCPSRLVSCHITCLWLLRSPVAGWSAMRRF